VAKTHGPLEWWSNNRQAMGAGFGSELDWVIGVAANGRGEIEEGKNVAYRRIKLG
jgi:hypothetical protein